MPHPAVGWQHATQVHEQGAAFLLKGGLHTHEHVAFKGPQAEARRCGHAGFQTCGLLALLGGQQGSKVEDDSVGKQSAPVLLEKSIAHLFVDGPHRAERVFLHGVLLS